MAWQIFAALAVKALRRNKKQTRQKVGEDADFDPATFAPVAQGTLPEAIQRADYLEVRGIGIGELAAVDD